MGGCHKKRLKNSVIDKAYELLQKCSDLRLELQQQIQPNEVGHQVQLVLETDQASIIQKINKSLDHESSNYVHNSSSTSQIVKSTLLDVESLGAGEVGIRPDELFVVLGDGHGKENGLCNADCMNEEHCADLMGLEPLAEKEKQLPKMAKNGYMEVKDCSLNLTTYSRGKSCRKQKKRLRSDLELETNDQKEREKAGLFAGIRAFFVDGGISKGRLQIWKSRVTSLGGYVITSKEEFKDGVSHILAINREFLEKAIDLPKLKYSKAPSIISYDWVEDCLKDGSILPCTKYALLDFSIEMSEPSIRDAIIVGSDSGTGKELPEEVTQNRKDTGTSQIWLTKHNKQGEVKVKVNLNKKLCLQLNSGRDHNTDQSDTEADHEFEESADLNKHITGPLSELCHIYEDVLGDDWRALTYRKTVNKIQRLDFKLESIEELHQIDGIGSSMIEKIRELIGTEQLKKLEHFKMDRKVQTILQFSSVWGIGPTQARKYFMDGYKNIKDLVSDPSLSTMARMGVMYHEDISMRIPRAEVVEIEHFVRTAAETLCPGAWVNATGSFRRGQATCGDVDILITHPDGHSQEGLLARLVQDLKKVDFIVDGLHAGDHSLEGTGHADSFMGICQLSEKKRRRLDIKVYPRASYAFALIYFTGNDILNRRIRYFARRQGYKLSDKGLFLRPGNEKNGKVSNVSIPCDTERDVFDTLGLEYPEPHERNW